MEHKHHSVEQHEAQTPGDGGRGKQAHPHTHDKHEGHTSAMFKGRSAGVAYKAGILLSPAVGALFMSFSIVIVAINAVLLRRAKLEGGT